MAISVLFSLLCLASCSSGLQLKIEGRHNVRPRHELLRRGNMDGTVALSNSADIDYTTNLTLGGQLFTVEIDTGSSDLWVAGNITDSIDTGTTTEISYAKDGAEGSIKTSVLEFAGYTVHDQAFLQVTPDSEHPIGIGIIGLGPMSGSFIHNKMNTSAGYPVLDRIFLQNTSTPNYLTVLLGRTQDPTDVLSGEMPIGELLDGYSNVEGEPKLEVTFVSDGNSSHQHFQILLDEDGIIGPDGKPISITTEVNQTSNSKQATVVLDTGTSTSQVPKYVNMVPTFREKSTEFTTLIRYVADAIYSRISGAEYRNITGIGEIWAIPCDEEVNITFKFSGKSYHIHPLDATMDPSLFGSPKIVNSKGETSCLGPFQPFVFTPSYLTYDMILGMSFLRNVYTVFNFGDFVAGGNDTTNRGDPYIQLLSTTDPVEAHSDFVAVRLSGLV
ncbi:aspartic peptidase domain-containing protein [Armillaria fumosa]|nr:aspartic peptidase domain-containing protein [Armillaria fumosa]